MNIKNAIFEHYKGMKYLVLGVAKHSETLEELVVYIPLYDNKESKIWVRPKSMFFEDVEVNGRTVPRFKLLDE